MIRRNIDIVAIAILLAVIGFYSHAREAMVLEVSPAHGIVLSRDIANRVMGVIRNTSAAPLPLVTICPR